MEYLIYNEKAFKLYLFPFLLLTQTEVAHAQANYLKITNYKVYYGWATHYPQDWMIIRQFENEGKNYFLLVNPQTLETRIDEPSFYKVKPLTLSEARDFFRNSPYIKAIKKAERHSVNTQDAGIENGMPKQTGISLTADLCPSHRPLDKRIFTEIISEFQKVEYPVPVALSVSGIWMKQHQQDLEWLKKCMRSIK
ncbi:hypothetical protein MgSA37_04489 [Mucilaginibacter gotjawali]|uniref:Uncharacterized protein n=1 Tax=Mucilaginibacter gotjawali TaxID=1550579 RepID=A0A120MZ22_9SPHI|nr:hypothetical protein MgSA37_04489 [Mucilaginibacter gotjawali]